MDLTTPMECLFGGIYVDRSDEGSHVLYELVQHLSDTKNIFLDPRLSKSILTQMERLLSKETEEMALTEKHCLLNCITLLRNVLHIPDNSESSTNSNSNRYIVKKSKLSSENASSPSLKCFFSDKTRYIYKKSKLHSAWNVQNFSVIQILREIKFGGCRSCKSTVLQS